MKNKVYVVLAVDAPCCGAWCVDIGAIGNADLQYCSDCNKIISTKKTKRWHAAKHFAPIEENFQSISLEKILEKETPLINVN